jgi:paired amphipathic helix protein Sin3a
VIDRVSTLFRGHPTLIQGFNTFLPPGYRIDCPANGADGVITVTTPTGTVSHVPGGFSAALKEEARLRNRAEEQKKEGAPAVVPTAQTATPAASGLPVNTVPVVPPATYRPFPPARTSRPPQPANTPASVPLPPAPQPPKAPSGPSTPSTAALLAAGLNQEPASGARPPGVEFNHAISFVNKIKVRFQNDAETYKQFLEILQTYQRDGRDILDVSQSICIAHPTRSMRRCQSYLVTLPTSSTSSSNSYPSSTAVLHPVPTTLARSCRQLRMNRRLRWVRRGGPGRIPRQRQPGRSGVRLSRKAGPR